MSTGAGIEQNEAVLVGGHHEQGRLGRAAGQLQGGEADVVVPSLVQRDARGWRAGGSGVPAAQPGRTAHTAKHPGGLAPRHRLCDAFHTPKSISAEARSGVRTRCEEWVQFPPL